MGKKGPADCQPGLNNWIAVILLERSGPGHPANKSAGHRINHQVEKLQGGGAHQVLIFGAENHGAVTLGMAFDTQASHSKIVFNHASGGQGVAEPFQRRHVQVEQQRLRQHRMDSAGIYGG